MLNLKPQILTLFFLIFSQAYMVQANEVLWAKPLQPLLEEILQNGGGVGDESIRKVCVLYVCVLCVCVCVVCVCCVCVCV